MPLLVTLCLPIERFETQFLIGRVVCTTKLNKYNGDTSKLQYHQQPPLKVVFGKGCLKSSRQVVKFGLVYASRYLSRAKEKEISGH